jgi:hypothetical protein
VAERPHKSVTLEEKTEVIRRTEGGQTYLNVCRDLNMAPSIGRTIMKNADKIKKTMETARRKTTTTLRYSCGPVIGIIEELLSLYVGESNERNILLW